MISCHCTPGDDAHQATEQLVQAIAISLKTGHIEPTDREIRIVRSGIAGRFLPPKLSEKRWVAGSITSEPDDLDIYPESAVYYQEVFISEDGEIDVLGRESRPLQPQDISLCTLEIVFADVLQSIHQQRQSVRLYTDYLTLG